MTLNDLELRNSPYFVFFSPNSIALQAYYVTVVEDRPIMSVKYYLPVPVFHYWPKLVQPAARSLCDSWASCIICVMLYAIAMGQIIIEQWWILKENLTCLHVHRYQQQQQQQQQWHSMFGWHMCPSSPAASSCPRGNTRPVGSSFSPSCRLCYVI